MTHDQVKQLQSAADNALRLLNQMQATLMPIASLSLPLTAQDVKTIHELTRDAAAPLRNALSNATIAPDGIESLANRAIYYWDHYCLQHEIDYLISANQFRIDYLRAGGTNHANVLDAIEQTVKTVLAQK